MAEAADPIMAEEGDGQQVDGDGKRERSTIKFPYGDLSDAVDVAKGVHGEFGTSCEWDQLAAQLKQAADGGGFRQKMLTAKLFGVVDYSQRKVTLTTLGHQICDPKQEKSAKAQAFLAVPLYKAIFEKFKGNTLPPPNALESEMAGLGVAVKQTEKARQYFQRSAEQAGFFWSGTDRLVMPATKSNGDAGSKQDESLDDTGTDKKKLKGGGGGDGGAGDYHPFIAGLLKTLPPADTDWPMDARRKWLQAASTIFEVIYKDSESKGSLRIEVQKDSGR